MWFICSTVCSVYKNCFHFIICTFNSSNNNNNNHNNNINDNSNNNNHNNDDDNENENENANETIAKNFMSSDQF